MKIKVKLSEIIEAIEFDSEMSSSYLNLNNGEVVTIMEESFRAAEDEEPLEKFPQWQHEDIEMAKKLLNERDSFLPLPSKYDFHEYHVIEEFCFSIEDRLISNSLLSAIKGRGAFRRFKDKILQLGIEKKWYRFREEKLKQFAIDWCSMNDIDYLDDSHKGDGV